MAFEPKEWQNYPNTDTPITAEELNRIEGGLSDVHSRTSQLRESRNIFDVDAISNGAVRTDGSLNPNNTLTVASDFIPVNGGSVYRVSNYGQPAPGGSYGVAAHRYNSNYEYESTSTGSRMVTNDTTAYLRFTIHRPYLDGLQIEEGEEITPYGSYKGVLIEGLDVEDVGRVSSAILNPESRVSPIRDSRNIFDINGELYEGIIRESDGTLNPNYSLAVATDFIPVNGLSVYRLSNYGVPVPGGSFGIITRRYNSNYEYETTSVGSRIVTNDTTAYLRFSIYKEYLDGLQIEEGEDITPYASYKGVVFEGLDAEGVGRVSTAILNLESRIKSLEEGGSGNFNSRSRVPDRELEWQPLNHTARQIGTSFDGNLYTWGLTHGNVRVRKSTDSGETFTTTEGIKEQDLNSNGLASFAVWSDSSVLYVGRNGRILRADSFDSEPRLVYETTTGNPLHAIATIFYETRDGKRYAFAGEYDHESTQKTYYYSKDAGETWDILALGGTLHTGNNHWHCMGYDPYSDEVWLAEGDGNNARLHHSRDWGDDWEILEGPQPTAIMSFPDRVVFGRDRMQVSPGMDYWNRTSEYDYIQLGTAFEFEEDYYSYHFYPTSTAWNQFTDEYYLLYPSRVEDVDDNYIFGTGDGGLTWHLVYKGQDVDKHLAGLDPRGYLFAVESGLDGGIYRAKVPTWTFPTEN